MSDVYQATYESWIERFVKRLSGRHIFINNKPYLSRYYLVGDGSGQGLEVYIHKLHTRDEFRWLHNHPWQWFLSIVLAGYYEQEILEPRKSPNRRKQRINRVNFFRNMTRYHSIIEVPPGGTWTLVIVPPKRPMKPAWGFWNEELQRHEPDQSERSSDAQTVDFGPQTRND